MKRLLLVSTAALAVHARLRLIPHLTDANLTGLARQIRYGEPAPRAPALAVSGEPALPSSQP